MFFFSCQSDEKEVEIPQILVVKSSEKVNVQDGQVYVNQKLFSGYLISFYFNTSDTLSKEGFLNGKQHGTSKRWYPKGILSEVREYRNGAKNGRQVAFWENGNTQFDFLSINDAYEGEYKEWNNEGKLIHLAHYSNGQEEGVQKLWYDNGKIRANYIIKNGKRYGLLGTKNCINVSDSIPSFQ